MQVHDMFGYFTNLVYRYIFDSSQEYVIQMTSLMLFTPRTGMCSVVQHVVIAISISLFPVHKYGLLQPYV